MASPAPRGTMECATGLDVSRGSCTKRRPPESHKLGKHRAKFGRNREIASKSPKRRSSSAQVWPTPAQVWSTTGQDWPDVVVEVGPTLAGSGQMVANIGEFQPDVCRTWTRFDRFRAACGQHRHHFGRFGAKLGRLPTVAGCCRIQPTLDRRQSVMWASLERPGGVERIKSP